jgi:phosphatidylglycerol:prolipoprotein diacylglycerol transferase
MYQTLFTIPYEIGGVPFFGAGVLMALWSIAAVVLFARLIRAHGFDEETRSYIVPMLIVAAAIWFVPTLFPGGLPIRGYGVMMLLGSCAAVAAAAYRGRQMGLPTDLIFSLAFWLVIPGILGARLFHVIEYWELSYQQSTVWETFKRVINMPEGGLVVYGSLIGGAVGFAAFVRRYRLPTLAMADLIAPSLAIGLAIGRIGCLLNGCCYGGPCDRPWAVTFPAGSPPYEDQVARGELPGIDFRVAPDEAPRVRTALPDSSASGSRSLDGGGVVSINGHGVATTDAAWWQLKAEHDRGGPVAIVTRGGQQIQLPARSHPIHPTQIYSSVAALLLALVLWSYYPFRRRDGEVAALLLSIYPVQRILLEIIRTDERAVFQTGLSISQNVSLLLLLGVAIFWWYIERQPKGSALPMAGH